MESNTSLEELIQEGKPFTPVLTPTVLEATNGLKLRLLRVEYSTDYEKCKPVYELYS
jgi:hypothetical protein